jgi:predicted DNA-binding ribbon-helix-helix protein
LNRIAAQRGHTLSGLVSAADGGRVPMQPLASALRVLALRAFDPEAQDMGKDAETAPLPGEGLPS